MIGLISEADWPAAPGNDLRICDEAPERRAQTEGQGNAAEGLRDSERQRRKSARFIHQYGETGAQNTLDFDKKLDYINCCVHLTGNVPLVSPKIQ